MRGNRMKSKMKKAQAVASSAEGLAFKQDDDAKKDKQVVTLYLEKGPYVALQKMHNRKVSEIVNELIVAYLKARG